MRKFRQVIYLQNENKLRRLKYGYFILILYSRNTSSDHCKFGNWIGLLLGKYFAFLLKWWHEPALGDFRR